MVKRKKRSVCVCIKMDKITFHKITKKKKRKIQREEKTKQVL